MIKGTKDALRIAQRDLRGFKRDCVWQDWKALLAEAEKSEPLCLALIRTWKYLICTFSTRSVMAGWQVEQYLRDAMRRRDWDSTAVPSEKMRKCALTLKAVLGSAPDWLTDCSKRERSETWCTWLEYAFKQGNREALPDVWNYLEEPIPAQSHDPIDDDLIETNPRARKRSKHEGMIQSEELDELIGSESPSRASSEDAWSSSMIQSEELDELIGSESPSRASSEDAWSSSASPNIE